MKKGVAALFAVVVMAVVVQETTVAAPPPGVVCNPSELASCAWTVIFGSRPSAECCRKLRVQQPCFCTYIRDPQYKQFLLSSNAAKFTSVCNVTIPTTC
ncbi:non-specific lipid-transfer protein 2P [Salvia splendens]|uniref:non-specific lipid-transfer protein 2P n=1 Tax=Salvia splendens TaxID=180675 RepID=UPI0011030F5D|nr:non-specific lipid-transfer protein 2P [Salvia splendens]